MTPSNLKNIYYNLADNMIRGPAASCDDDCKASNISFFLPFDLFGCAAKFGKDDARCHRHVERLGCRTVGRIGRYK